VLRHEDFRDAAAVQFPLQPGEPSYIMGEQKGPVNIWHWKADWEADLARFRDIQDTYPNMAWDVYPFLRGVSGDDRGHVQVATASHDPTYLAGWGAGNLFSTPSRSTPVENLNATGLGTLTSQPPEHQTVKGHGSWADGRWRVVMVRSHQTPNERDAQFTAGTPVPVITKINADTLRVLQMPDVRNRLSALGFEIQGSSPREFETLVRADAEKFQRIIKDAGIKAN